jgi:hypothetical protein
MKKQKKLNIKLRDLDLLKDVTQGGRRHRAHSHAGAFDRGGFVGEYRGGLGPFGLRHIT